jgi:hypothetical protein
MAPRASLSDDDLDRLLSAADPVDRLILRADAVAEALTRMHSGLLGCVPAATAPAPPTRSRRGHRVRRWAAVSVTAVGVALAAVLLGVGGIERGAPGDRPSLAVSPAAAATLTGLARATDATARGTRPLGPHQYEYLKEIVFQLGAGGVGPWHVRYHDTSTVQMWVNRDGANRTLTRYDSLTWLTPADRATYEAHRRRLQAVLPDGAVGRETDTEYPAGDGPSAFAYGRGLPSTPGPLLRALQARFLTDVAQIPASQRRAWSRENRSGFLFSALGTILAGSISPTQRAAAFIDARYINGVQVLGDGRDAIGRTGTAIKLAGPGDTVQELLIDPADGALLQTEFGTRTSRDARAIHRLDIRSVNLQSAVVDSMQTLPDGRHLTYHNRAIDR